MDQNATGTPNNSFAEIISQVSHGAINDEATNELKALVAEMMRCARDVGGKPKGKIVVTLSLALEKGIFDVYGSVKAQMPAKVQPRAILYAAKNGLLSENDQRQYAFEMPPKDVTSEAATSVRSIASITDHRMAKANDR
jgi:hypothetical protein